MAAAEDNSGKNGKENLYKINKDRFWSRVESMHSSWANELNGGGDPNWNGCDCILIACGKNDNIAFKKNNTIHLWLFGIQLLSTIMVITTDTIYICCGERTRQVLLDLGEANESGSLKLAFIVKDKSDSYKANHSQLVAILESSDAGKGRGKGGAKSVGFINENQIGKFIKNFLHLVGGDNPDNYAQGKGGGGGAGGARGVDESKKEEDDGGAGKGGQFAFVDYSPALSSLTMIKDAYELRIMERIGELSSNIFLYARSRIEKCVQRDLKRKHSELMEDVIQLMDNGARFDKMFHKNKQKNGSHASFKQDNLDVCYNPVIQSGGKFKLKLKETSESDNEILYYNGGVVVIMIGFKLKDYCVNVARTLYFDATKEQKEIYQVLLKAFKKGLITLRNGVPLANVYNAALKVVKTKRPDLEKNFLKNVGWGMGLELRDKNYVIDRKSSMIARTGMVFNFQVGFQNLIDQTKAKGGDDKASHYSAIIADTVLVTDGQMGWVTKVNRHITDYEIGDPNEAKEEKNGNENKNKNKSNDKGSGKKKNKKRRRGNEDEGSADDDVGTATDSRKSSDMAMEAENGRRYVTRNSNRAAQAKRQENQKARQEREKNQSKLRELKSKRLDKLFRETGGDLSTKVEEKEYKDPMCYNDSSHLPSNLTNKSLYVDFKSECLICPIMDHMVPFHISTLKNYSLQQHHSKESGNSNYKHRNSGDNWTYLRINFVSTVAQNSNRRVKQPLVSIHHSDAMFIKELTYRSMSNNLVTVSDQIKQLQKQIKLKEKQANDTPLVKQDKLVRAKSQNKMIMLKDLSVRPSLGGIRKKNTGRLECHHNGLRYIDHKKNEIHILFNNIKCAFFQPAKNTPAVLIHFHLKHAIIIGKKPSTDVQCYRDVIDRFEDIGRSNYDYDGIAAEKEERMRIQRTNKQFSAFVKGLEKLSKENSNGEYGMEFEIPEMDLKFEGVPHKQSVRMYPTSHCLVGLEDNPPFVLSTKDVELAHFERVDFALKNFDIAFVFKDYNKEPMKVATIPRQHLDTLQDFLNWQNVLYSQAKSNLDWKEIMKNIRENLEEFIDNGGWDFLREEELAWQGASLPSRSPAKSDTSSPGKKHGKKSKKSKKKSKNRQEDYYGAEEEEWRPSEDDYDDYDDDGSNDGYTDGSDEYSGEYSDEYSDDGGRSEEEEEEPGLDWDELEKQAISSDKQARLKDRNREFMDSRDQRSNKRRKR